MTVTVKNKINQKWLKDVFYSFARHVRKPEFTDNKEVAYEFADLNAAIKTVSNLNDYGLNEWAFYENGKLTEVIK